MYNPLDSSAIESEKHFAFCSKLLIVAGGRTCRSVAWP